MGEKNIVPSVRRLEAGEWWAYREIRLRALADAPDAFGSTVEHEARRVDSEWAARLSSAASVANQCPVVAEVAGELVGLAWGFIDPATPETAHLYQMWVAPEARGQGVGAMLVDTVVEWARRAQTDHIVLRVASGDTPARRLYDRAGFRPFGEVEPLRPGSTVQTQPMRLELGPDPVRTDRVHTTVPGRTG